MQALEGALRRAQMEIDLCPELYKHYHLRSAPAKYREQVDVRAFGTGERIVLLEYTRETSRRPGTGPRPTTCSAARRRPATTRLPWFDTERAWPFAYLTLIRVPCSAPSQISRITPAAATSNTCMVRDCSLASTNALVSMMRTPAASASS